MKKFYVSPDGSDSWSGLSAGANASKTDGPFLTLWAAAQAVKCYKAACTAPEEIRVCLRGGLYELDRPWVLTA